MKDNLIDKRVKVISTNGFLLSHKNLENYIGQTGNINKIFNYYEDRVSIYFDDKEFNIMNYDNGKLLFALDDIEFIDNEKENYKQKEFEVGDMIEVVNKYNHENSTAGGSYPYYPLFFQENGFYELKSRYIEIGVKNGVYKIVGIGRNSMYPDTIVYVLEKDNDIYLMSNTYNEMEKVNNDNVKENDIMPKMTQTNNQLQTHENLHARLGDTLILSNGLKLKVCKDFCDRDTQYYKTVDISCNTNVTIVLQEISTVL